MTEVHLQTVYNNVRGVHVFKRARGHMPPPPPPIPSLIVPPLVPPYKKKLFHVNHICTHVTGNLFPPPYPHWKNPVTTCISHLQLHIIHYSFPHTCILDTSVLVIKLVETNISFYNTFSITCSKLIHCTCPE